MTIDKEKLKALMEIMIRDMEGDLSEGEARNFHQHVADYETMTQPATILALLAEIERHEAWRTAFLDERNAQMRQRDQLKAENEELRKDVDLVTAGRVKLAGAMSRLRAKHNDWTAPEHFPTDELVWCACGDGFPPNSYGAGFMDANNGVCWSCDAAKEASHD
ncbi:hypothetical protein WLF18_01165 [Pseudomonas shirazensis]|uniref:Zinc-ribbon containing domain-containing protein n=1 Tax=Pseudomonas shirazensis TaxID=2745494 RepID=A0ABU8ZUW3_9PSED